jgi:hypothetical protein
VWLCCVREKVAELTQLFHYTSADFKNRGDFLNKIFILLKISLVIRDQRFKFHGEKMVSKLTFFESFYPFQLSLKGLRKNRFKNKAKRAVLAEH